MSELPFQFKFREAGIDMSQMKKLDARQELLVITMEECGELIHACSKNYEEVSCLKTLTQNKNLNKKLVMCMQ